MSNQVPKRDRRPDMVFLFAPSFSEHLGTGYIIAYLLQNGYQAEQLRISEPVTISRCVNQVLARKPPVVGFSVWDFNYSYCLAIAEEIKNQSRGTVVVFGGPTPSAHAQTILQENRSVDICVMFEGEDTTLELLTVLQSCNYDLAGAALDGVRGIAFRGDDGIVQTETRNAFFSGGVVAGYLDKYPSPYLSGVLTTTEPGMVTARGCTQHCVYCCCAALSKRRIVSHTVDRVIEELDRASRLPIEEVFSIFDDAFSLMPKRALEICDRIIENKIKIPLNCVTRADKVSEELLERMKEAGFIGLGLSLESGVPRILRQIGKVQDPLTDRDPTFEKEKEFIELWRKYTTYAKKIGIRRVYSSIMVGLPGETADEARQTIDTIRSVGDSLDTYRHNRFIVYRGTPIFTNYKSFGLDLQPLGNKVQSKTIHSFDTNEVAMAPNAMEVLTVMNEHVETIESLALSLSSTEETGLFRNVLLCCDSMSNAHVIWFRDNLAMHGKIAIIYSDLEAAKANHQSNHMMLVNLLSPSTRLLAYYRRSENKDETVLYPFSVWYDNHHLWPQIHVKPFRASLINEEPSVSPLHCIAGEDDRTAALEFHDFLVHAAEHGRLSGTDLFRNRAYPYFPNLCRWEEDVQNCRLLETAIVEQDGSVKPCWSGSTIGTVGMSYEEIRQNFRQQALLAEQARCCERCEVSDSCSRCLFTQPLGPDEFCRLRRCNQMGTTPEILRSLDDLKRMLPPQPEIMLDYPR